MIQLWPLEGPSSPVPLDPPQITERSEHFILEFSPGRKVSAVVARGKSEVVEILDLDLGPRSSVRPLTLEWRSMV
jgi:hypothetical protein